MKAKLIITESQYKRLVEAIKKNKLLKEQWNPSDNYTGPFFIATAPMDEPGEVRAHVISQDEYDEYQNADWDIEGPYDETEARLRYDKIGGGNNLWNAMGRVSDRDAERQEMDYFRSGDDSYGKPEHMKALDDYHSTKKDLEDKINRHKSKFRDPNAW